MARATELLHYVDAFAAVMLAAVAAREAKRGGRHGRWGAAAFAALAAVLLVSALDQDEPAEWIRKGLICLLLAFPYLLLRFTASFGVMPAAFSRFAAGATAVIMATSVLLPGLPDDGAVRPAWYLAYVSMVVVFWTTLSLATIVCLWRAGACQPTLTRRRVRLMSAATAAMNALILLAAAGASEGAGDLLVQILLALCLASFAVGFAPPRLVRLAWRQPEQDALRHATEELVGAATVTEVTDTLLPHVARVVGGSGAALCNQDLNVMTSFGHVPPIDTGVASQSRGETVQVVPLSPPFGALVVATSPLTPFFGREEIALLHALAALADISLARCALNERERDSQIALQSAKEEAERASKAKSGFLSRMSHELRTPLNVVLGFGQILEMRGSLDERDEEAVGHILNAGRHLLELINEVLDLSAIEAGRLAVSLEPVEVTEIAREALELIRPLADARSVRLDLDLGPCAVYVTADRQRLKQVLLNLLSNAVKYNRERGQIAVSCAVRAGGRVRVRVKDTGPGMSAALMDRLFQPFERLGAEQGDVEGTGLGLALSRQLVELMGGEIGVESREGEGSVFWIELDVAQPRQELGTPPRPVRDAGNGNGIVRPWGSRRLLLVEDNLANVNVIESVMARRPHVELLPAMTGRLGLELARKNRPDLILLDQHLPDLTGAEVLNRLKADPQTRDMPVVIVSADATPGQVGRLLELGAADYLTKPLDIPTFLEVVDGLLDAGEPAA